MTDDARIPEGPEADAALAAEYVLGVLDEADRAEAAGRIARDPEFARLVGEWEAHFSAMDDAFTDEAPPAHLKSAIAQRLHGNERAPAPAGGLWSRAGFWQLTTAASLAALAIVSVLALRPPEPAVTPAGTVLATLSSEETEERFVVIYEEATMRLSAVHVAGKPVEGRDFELWLIEGDNAPVSAGLVGHEGPDGPHLPEGHDAPVEGTVFAVSLEPAGGAPDGNPTGPVVAAGPAKKI